MLELHRSRTFRNDEFQSQLGEKFKELVKPYLLSSFTKGVPSIYTDVKALCQDRGKRDIIEGIVENARECFAGGAVRASLTLSSS
jgi:peptide alpha-N-acetyltransferase